MRRLLSALAASFLLIGAVLALVPGSFAAGPAPTDFQYGIVAGEGPPPTGGRFDYDARLVHDGTEPVAGATATLQARAYGESGFTPVASATTASDGSVHVSVVLHTTTRLRWAFAGTASYAATVSPAFTEQVAPRVVARAKDRTLTRHQRVVVVGRTTPAKPGTRVSLWRGDVPAFAPGLQMTRIAVATIGPDGTFRLAARFAHPGAKQLYVKVNGGQGTAVGFSPYLHIRVSS